MQSLILMAIFLALLLLAALGAATGFAIVGMRRQLRGQHPSAEGGFRWR